MFKLLRFPFSAPTETDEEFRLRMAQFHQDMDALCQKQPAEVTGDPLEAVYYGMKLSEALKAGDQAEARLCLSRMVRISPCDSLVRLAASAGYAQLGEEVGAMAQLGIALGLQPENYAVHKRMAYHLVKRGEQQAAEAILEQGWIHCRKHVPKGEREAKRSEYFSILENEQAA
jgi:predicted Zn-dependent protease